MTDDGRDTLPPVLIGATPPGGARILVIDDEPEIRRAVRGGLTGAHFVVELAATGAEGLELAARWHPDVVILDLALPDADGVEVLASLRAWSAVPVIVLSVRAGDRDKIAALDRGADDYLTKPFSIDELLARIRVALRHAAHSAGGEATGARFQSAGLVLDFERRRVSVNDSEVRLTPTEYEVLKYLAMHAGRVITHRTLLRAVWGPEYESEAHYLRVFIGQLRRKIEPEPSRPAYILTEPGIGYRLRTPE
ncbi:MAG TPA: response regulator transcription factor [Ktedonobacterales bacterium]|jgi:two-component system KDP operon response regulator KdpE|nr:response regulator transcription factor [Ktedonobacterales bacterium]